MKAIIDGKRYNTETAQSIAYNCNNSNDFRAFEENLYRTPRGNWFLVGEGGPLSQYARACEGGGYTSGKRLIPLSYENARIWLERNGETAVIEEYFADEIEDA